MHSGSDAIVDVCIDAIRVNSRDERCQIGVHASRSSQITSALANQLAFKERLCVRKQRL